MIEVVIACLLVFVIYRLAHLTYRIGYKDGANRVIKEWKQTLRKMEDDGDE